MDSYAPLFKSYRSDVSDKAHRYVRGLMQAGSRKNMERMVEVVSDSDWQQLQQFISDSSWDRQAVIDQIARDADSLLGDAEDCCLAIDESSFAKKGKKSVGVARQWLGRHGKVDNGQVGVFAALCNATRATLVNERFFLPEEWANDMERCLKAGMPEEEIVHKTKQELALEMVRDAQRLGLRYGWIAADAGYGHGLGFCMSLQSLGETFVVDCDCDQHVYSANPKPYVPVKPKGKRGRIPKKLITDEVSIRVDTWAKSQPEKAWRLVTVRQGTKGPVAYEYLTKQVWVWDKDNEKPFRWWLIVRRDPKSKSDYKYSLSNASGKTSVQRLAFMQGQRFWVERCFEDARSECGMADYQVRKWRGWHSHMTLVMLSMLFMLHEKIRHQDEYPLLSAADVEDLLAHFLPRKDRSVDAVIAHLQRRHKQRQRSIDAASRSAKAKRKSLVPS